MHEIAGRLHENRSQLAEAGEKVARRAAEAQCCLAVLAGDMNWNDADGGDPLEVLQSPRKLVQFRAISPCRRGPSRGTACDCGGRRLEGCVAGGQRLAP